MMVGILLMMLFLMVILFVKKFDLMLLYFWMMFFGLALFCFYSGLEFFHMSFIVDGVSLNLIILSIWISFLMVFSSMKTMKAGEGFEKLFYLIFVLMMILVVTFLVNDLIMFYFFFEASLIPTLIIIMGWGYQPERIQAGVYFMFYTLTASLPLLLVSVYYFNFLGGVVLGDMNVFVNLKVSSCMGVILFLMTSMAFLVKLPMYFTHLWLPSAHVEAPVAGSMILAGVLLKLGGYGIIRVSFLLKFMAGIIVSILVGLSLFSMVYVGLMCCRLNDFKALVAYSSVAHMSMVISGSIIMNLWGMVGALMMMISHGLSSSGLFCIVNMFYERLSSRSFYINSGLLLLFPFLSLMMFLLSVSNIAAPPTINLISEIFLMISMMGFSYFMVLVFPLGSFLGAVFTIFMYSFSQHGKLFMSSFSFNLVSFRELHILVLHLIPVYFVLVSTDLFLVK